MPQPLLFFYGCYLKKGEIKDRTWQNEISTCSQNSFFHVIDLTQAIWGFNLLIGLLINNYVFEVK